MHFWSDNPEQRPSLDGRFVAGIVLAVLVLIAAAKPMLRARGDVEAAGPAGGLQRTAAKPLNSARQAAAGYEDRPSLSAGKGR
jgi:hypothetical protein